MGIVNRRNAVLGWGVWQVSKRAAKQKAKGSSGSGRPNKSMVAVGLAGAAGALTFWRKRRSGDSTP
jgi:hypothetical protein